MTIAYSEDAYSTVTYDEDGSITVYMVDAVWRELESGGAAGVDEHGSWAVASGHRGPTIARRVVIVERPEDAARGPRIGGGDDRIPLLDCTFGRERELVHVKLSYEAWLALRDPDDYAHMRDGWPRLIVNCPRRGLASVSASFHDLVLDG